MVQAQQQHRPVFVAQQAGAQQRRLAEVERHGDAMAQFGFQVGVGGQVHAFEVEIHTRFDHLHRPVIDQHEARAQAGVAFDQPTQGGLQCGDIRPAMNA